MKVWGWPGLFAFSTALGLVGALCGNGHLDWMGWIGLGAPVGAALYFSLKSP